VDHAADQVFQFLGGARGQLATFWIAKKNLQLGKYLKKFSGAPISGSSLTTQPAYYSVAKSGRLAANTYREKQRLLNERFSWAKSSI